VEYGLKSALYRALRLTHRENAPIIPQITAKVKHFIFQKGLDKPCSTWYTSYVEWEKGIRMSIQRTLIETKYKLNLMTERYTKYILWQTDHYQYEVDMIATFNYRKFTKTVKLNQMAFEEAIKVFKKESTEEAFKAARTTRAYLDA